MNSSEFKVNSADIMTNALKNITKELLTFTCKLSIDFFDGLNHQYKVKISKEGRDILCQEQVKEEDLQKIQD